MQARDRDEQAFVVAVEVWDERDLWPVAKQYDQADEYPTAIVEQMKALGLFGATIGTDWGSVGLSA